MSLRAQAAKQPFRLLQNQESYMDQKLPLYQKIAQLLQEMQTCSDDLQERHKVPIDQVVERYLPQDAGFEAGTLLWFEKSTPEKLIFHTEYHHSVEDTYTHFTHHNVIVTPSLANQIHVKVTGSNDNDIKSHIEKVFYFALTSPYDDL